MLGHVNGRWEAVPIGEVQHMDVQQWVFDMTNSGTGPDSVRGAFRTLHEIVKLAIRARKLSLDPCDGVQLPRVERREMLFLEPPQVNDLAEAIEISFPGFGWGLMVKFAAYSGLRAGELGGLQVRDLDLLHQRIRVHRARKADGSDGNPKSGSTRWVDLPRQLCEEVTEYLSTREFGPDSRVWTGERGGPLNHKWFYRNRFKPIVNKLTDQGRLPSATGRRGEALSLRFHDLRHTCVAILIGKGAQQYEVMEDLGHTKIQTTIDTYGHIFPAVRQRIRAALEDTWDEAAATS